MATWQELLSGRNLTGVVQGVKSGLPIRVPTQFLTPTRNVEGNTATYHRVNGNRQLARIVQYGSPARRRGLTGITEVPVTLLHSFESQELPQALMTNVKNPATDEVDEMGRAEVSRQTRDFKQLFTNLRVAAVQMAIAKGEVHFDGDGNLLPSSSGAKVSVDFGIPSDNEGNLTGSSTILGGAAAKWSASASDIVSQMRDLKKLALQTTGYPLAYAFYGGNVPGYLAANDSIGTWIQSNAPLALQANQQMLASGEVAQGLLGLQWIPMDDAFFVDQTETVQEMISADSIVFTPAPSQDWYEMFQGSFLIPSGLGQVGMDANSMTGAIQKVYGQFSYAAIKHNPVSIEQYAGDTFLPLIKVPGAVFNTNIHW